MKLSVKWISCGLSLAALAFPANSQGQAVTPEQIRALTVSVDRLTSTNYEMLRRLERIETRTQSLIGIRQTVDALTTSQATLLNHVQQLRTQVAAASTAKAAVTTTATPVPPPPGPKLPIAIDLGPGRMQGNADSTVTLVMFSDAQCGFCFRFLNQTFPTLKTEFLDTGKMRFALRDLTLASHRDANKGAMAMRCAEEQGKYWEMVSQIYAQQFDVTTSALKMRAEKAALDAEQFASCFDSEKYLKAAGEDMVKARKLGFRSTPTFAIGYSEPGSSETTVTKVIIGARQLDVFRGAINAAIAEGIPPK